MRDWMDYLKNNFCNFLIPSEREWQSIFSLLTSKEVPFGEDFNVKTNLHKTLERKKITQDGKGLLKHNSRAETRTVD